MKSLQQIREQIMEQTPSYTPIEAYAQYLCRNNQRVGMDSWWIFIGFYNSGRKRAKPLRVIQGGLQ